MKDVNETLEYKGTKYTLVFNLNVLEALQEEFGTFEKWCDLIEGKKTGEPDIKALKKAYLEMINEGIEIENEKNGTDIKPLNLRQIGRMFTEIGLNGMVDKLDTIIPASTKSSETSKNE